MMKNGFASLSASMLIRERKLPASAAADDGEGNNIRQRGSYAPMGAAHATRIGLPGEAPPAHIVGRDDVRPFGRLQPGTAPVKKARGNEDAPRIFRTGPATIQTGHPVPPEDQRHYQGPERRQHDVSPMVERRRGRKRRVKVSVRLEHDRYERLKIASEELARTHQDLLTCALDHYLDLLRIEQVEHPRRRPHPHQHRKTDE